MSQEKENLQITTTTQPPVQSEIKMDGDGNGDGSSSSDVSSTAADEGPPADHKLTSPPTDLYYTEDEVAVYRLYVRTRRSSSRRRTTTRARLDEEEDDEYDGGDGGGGDDDREEDEDEENGVYDDFFTLGAVPASGLAIACLPKTTVAEGLGRGRGECAVCLDGHGAGDAVRTMPCAHGFHERCIFKWLRASRLCPLCRFKLPPKEEDEREAGDEEEDDYGAFEYLITDDEDEPAILLP